MKKRQSVERRNSSYSALPFSNLRASDHFKYLLKQPILPKKVQLKKVGKYQRASGVEKDRLREELFLSNWRLIYKIAMKFAGRVGVDTLYQAGCIGFLEALDKIDPSRGNNVPTVATPWIRQKIIRTINKEGFEVRLPEYAYALIHKPLKTARKSSPNLTLEQGVTKATAKKLLGKVCTSAELCMFYTYFQKGVPVNELGYEYDTERSKFYTATALRSEELPTILEQIEQKHDVHKSLKAIKEPRAKDIIYRFFGLDGKAPDTLQKLGRKHKICRERVRQIIHETFDKHLRKPLRAYDPKT